ncbi:hypothetical protein [Streptomyces sp. NPDC059611]|uniref:hypothetical protein n=1 Tax=Streptomyces sp. NPDC059611 TaxID=3346884 RepID=UPI0036C8E3A2
MATSIPLASPLEKITAASAEMGPVGTWVGAGVAAVALWWAVRVFLHGPLSRREEVREELHDFLKKLEEIDGVFTAADIAMIRRRSDNFDRLARINPTRRELADVNRDIAAVCAIGDPRLGEDRDLYQQRLGEAVGRLKGTLNKAYVKLRT